MASSLILFRRSSLRALSGLHHSFTSLSVPISSSSSSSSISSSPSRVESPNFTIQSRSFRSTSISLLSSRYEDRNNIDSIGPDTILFEGCDYNHWLFVMDFPRDNKPTPEEMIRVYEETCAKGLNISVEEAKKKIYACSTTTYTGFQAVVTEEESKKFEGLPGVIFVLPDSYIDPVNKQYGGDQYIDGKIIPRPPPVQFGRNQGGRRDFNRQNNSMPNNQGSPSYNNRGPMPRDGRNYGPSQNYPPQQNYGPPPQIPPQQNVGQQPSNVRFDSALPHCPPQQSHAQASQGYPPKPNYGQVSQNYSPPQNINQAPHNYPPQQTYGPASPQYPPQQSFGPPGQGERRNYAPQQSFGPPGQGERRNYAPQQNFGPPGQGERNYVPQQNFGPPGQGERNYVPQQNFGPPQQNFGPPRQGERRDPVPSEGGWDFKPSYMEEFEQTEKEKSTGEGRY